MKNKTYYLKRSLNILLNIILIPLILVRSLNRRGLIRDAEKKEALALLIFLILLIGSLTLNWKSLTEDKTLIPNAKADTELTFNVEPPGSNWIIPKRILKGDYNEYQYTWTDYAWNTYHDKQFMLMLASENGLFNHNRRSLVPGEPSYGFCQIHKGYHPEIVNDKRFFTDPQWQMDQCYRLFKGGTPFYGYNRILTDSKFREDRVKLFNF